MNNNIYAAFSSALVAFLVALVILFLLSALLPGVNISVLFWSLIVAAVVFLLTLLGVRS